MKFISILIIIGLVSPLMSYAFIISNPLGGAFGGRILSVQYCTCSFSLLLSIGPPVGGSFIYTPGVSTLYKFYRVFSGGPWALGTSSGRSVCLVYAGTTCVSIGTGAIIRKIGTSLF